MRHKNRVFIYPGFSLTEALIVMFIVCAVAAFATPALTKLTKKQGQQTSDGMYACYYDGGKLTEWYKGGKERVLEAPLSSELQANGLVAGECRFKLNARDNAYYLIKAVGAGKSVTPGLYERIYIPRSDSEIRIKGTTLQGDVVVESYNGTDYETVLKALGGASNSSHLLRHDNIRSCKLRNAPAACEKAEQSGCKIAKHPTTGVMSFRITVCDKEEYVAIENNSDIKEDTNARDRNNNPIKRGVYKYGDSLMAVQFKDTRFADTETSELVEELKLNSNISEIENKLKTLGVGNKNEPGAVIIQW